MDLLYPLRLVVRANRRRRQRRAEAKVLRQYLSDCDQRTAVIPGTPLHENLGDSAIVLAQKAFLESCGFAVKEITWNQARTHRKLLRKIIPKDTLIAQLGGGNMGNQWQDEETLHRNLTVDFAQNPSVIFPQTVYYTPDPSGDAAKAASVPIYNGKRSLTLVAREAVSYEEMQRSYPDTKVLLTPDIVLSATTETFGVLPQQREGVLLCMRSDLERSMTDRQRSDVEALLAQKGEAIRYTDMYAAETVTPINRAALVRAKMEEFAAAKLVITDRLHGMIFATLTGTPCVVFSNSNHKIRGTCQWLRHLPYVRYVESAEEAADAVSALSGMAECRFDNAPLRKAFEPLKDAVRCSSEKSI